MLAADAADHNGLKSILSKHCVFPDFFLETAFAQASAIGEHLHIPKTMEGSADNPHDFITALLLWYLTHRDFPFVS